MAAAPAALPAAAVPRLPRRLHPRPPLVPPCALLPQPVQRQHRQLRVAVEQLGLELVALQARRGVAQVAQGTCNRRWCRLSQGQRSRLCRRRWLWHRDKSCWRGATGHYMRSTSQIVRLSDHSS